MKWKKKLENNTLFESCLRVNDTNMTRKPIRLFELAPHVNSGARPP